jgi:alpha-N-arabinofuranosidase
LRRQNGRDKAWKVKYLGVGNESWGCGGNMRAEYYSDLYRRYSTYCRDYDDNKLYKIASGATDYDWNWTKVLMENSKDLMQGISLHYYTVSGWVGSKGSATEFNHDDFYWTMGKCREIEDVIVKHCKIMDQYDPEKKVALLLDEWGTWWDVEPGTIPGHLYQQNTLRDAFVASLSLDIFHKYTDRLKMANIAQIVNVLQSMILTKEDKMLLTPTYHVFKMYGVHQEATYIPIELDCKIMNLEGERNQMREELIDYPVLRTLPMVSATASKNAEGKIHISLSNIDLENELEVTINLGDVKATKAVGEILTSAKIDDYNTFENPNLVKPAAFNEAKVKKGVLKVKLPAKSIVTLQLQ